MLFQSLAESSVHLKDTIKFLIQLFGPKAIESSFVLGSKADIANPGIWTTVEEICKEYKLPYAQWTNVCTGESQKTQIEIFRELVERIKTYDLEERSALTNTIQQEANQMRESEAELTNMPYTEDEKRVETEMETYQEPYSAAKYTPAQVESEAAAMQQRLPQDYTYYKDERYLQERWVTKQRKVVGHIFGIRYTNGYENYSVQEGEWRTKQVPYTGPRPIEIVKQYMLTLTEQRFHPVQRPIQREVVATVQKTRTEKVYKYAIEHYRKLAAKKVMEKTWEQVRTQL